MKACIYLRDNSSNCGDALRAQMLNCARCAYCRRLTVVAVYRERPPHGDGRRGDALDDLLADAIIGQFSAVIVPRRTLLGKKYISRLAALGIKVLSAEGQEGVELFADRDALCRAEANYTELMLAARIARNSTPLSVSASRLHSKADRGELACPIPEAPLSLRRRKTDESGARKLRIYRLRRKISPLAPEERERSLARLRRILSLKKQH